MSDYSIPFTNTNYLYNFFIPEEHVSSSTAKFDWRLAGREVKVTSGFNEIDPTHSNKSSYAYLDGRNPDPSKPKYTISGKPYNVGIDYVVGGDEKVTPWYSGTARLGGGAGKSITVETTHSYEYGGKKYPIYNVYSHLKSINVKEGASVNQDTVLGQMGGTGNRGKKYVPHVDFQSYIIVDGKRIQLSPNIMQANLFNQQGKYNNNNGEFKALDGKSKVDKVTDAKVEKTKDSSIQRTNDEVASSQEAVTDEKTKGTSSQNLTFQETESKSDVSKVVALLRENAAEVKKQYGLDVNTDEGLGKAVMQYWKENNLDPQVLKEQLPNMKSSEINAALAGATKTKQAEAQRQ
jgi:hypothetical protein